MSRVSLLTRNRSGCSSSANGDPNSRSNRPMPPTTSVTTRNTSSVSVNNGYYSRLSRCSMIRMQKTGGNSSCEPTCGLFRPHCCSSWLTNLPSNYRALGNATCRTPKTALLPQRPPNELFGSLGHLPSRPNSGGIPLVAPDMPLALTANACPSSKRAINALARLFFNQICTFSTCSG